jgi:hypothetical protein
MLYALQEQMTTCPKARHEIVSRFPRYQNAIGTLPATEQQKIRNVANIIRQSFRPGCRPIRTVRLVGHADRDIQQGPAFEKQISIDRARAVEQALKRWMGSPAISGRISWQSGGVGASSLIVPNPRTEAERTQNRRVEILLRQGAPNRWEHAVGENRRLAQALAWQAYKSSIISLLGFKSIPNEYGFAAAVARWQTAQRNLPANGIIGPETLKRINIALRAASSRPDTASAREASFHDVELDSGEMRRLYFEVRHELPEGAEKFWTEGKYLGLVDVKHGHGELTDKAARAVGIAGENLAALKRGVARPDESPPFLQQIDECQQHRHALRAALCQKMPAAIERIRSYLRILYDCVLSMPTLQVPDPKAQFELIGEALHLIQDSYSPAHMERNYGGPGKVHSINYIRFWHPITVGGSPLEHSFPVDLRDNLTVASIPLNWVDEAITASREFLRMILKHIRSAGNPGNIPELNAFLNKHLLLSGSHATFSQVISGLRSIGSVTQAEAYLVCLVQNPTLKQCENLLPGFCGPVKES